MIITKMSLGNEKHDLILIRTILMERIILTKLVEWKNNKEKSFNNSGRATSWKNLIDEIL